MVSSKSVRSSVKRFRLFCTLPPHTEKSTADASETRQVQTGPVDYRVPTPSVRGSRKCFFLTPDCPPSKVSNPTVCIKGGHRDDCAHFLFDHIYIPDLPKDWEPSEQWRTCNVDMGKTLSMPSCAVASLILLATATVKASGSAQLTVSCLMLLAQYSVRIDD